MTNKSKARLWSAYMWTCDSCGVDQFERSVTQELTPEERIEMAELNGVDPESMMCELVSIPDEVTCQHCGETFETIDHRAEDWSDDE